MQGFQYNRGYISAVPQYPTLPLPYSRHMEVRLAPPKENELPFESVYSAHLPDTDMASGPHSLIP